MSYIVLNPTGGKRVNSDRPLGQQISPYTKKLIRGALAAGEMNCVEIALAFGVSDRTVYRIRKGVTT